MRDLILSHTREAVKCPDCNSESVFYVHAASLRHGMAITKEQAANWASHPGGQP